MSSAYLSISDVAKQLALPAHTLRYWEKQFPSAVKPTSGTGGRRYYRPDVVAALCRIKELLYNNGYTIAGVKKLISDGTFMADVSDIQKSKPNCSDRIQPGAAKDSHIENIQKNDVKEVDSFESVLAGLQPTINANFDLELGRALDLLSAAKSVLE